MNCVYCHQPIVRARTDWLQRGEAWFDASRPKGQNAGLDVKYAPQYIHKLCRERQNRGIAAEQVSLEAA